MFFKRLSPCTLFSLTPSSLPSLYSIFIAQCSSSSPSHLTYPHSHSHPDPRNVRVSVWWDLDNCTMPPGVNVFRGAQAIKAAIESSGIKGPIQITAFGDMLPLARTDQEALSSTAIKFTHIPYDENYIAHSALFEGLACWVSRNPPPAHLFIITAFDVDSSSICILHHLRSQNYNILLATKDPAPTVLCTAATILWNWDALVRGENLTGKYLNCPPNCPWYDHYDGPLEDPFESTEELPEVFSQDSFWRDLKIFFNTDIGALIIEESSYNKDMIYYLKKHGPPAVKSLEGWHVSELVEKLMSDYLVLERPDLTRKFMRIEEVEETYGHDGELEKKIDELNSKIENLQKINEGLKNQIYETERALKVVEEEMMKSKN